MTPIYQSERQQAISDLRVVVRTPTPSHSGINMSAGGNVRFSFHGPRDVGIAIQKRIDARMIAVRDEIMGELLAEPALRDVRVV